MRYYDLDMNGKVVGSYANPQQGRTLYLLQEPAEDSPWMRDGVPGENWVPDQTAIDAINKEQARIERKRAGIVAELPNWETIRLEMVALINALQAATTIAQLRAASVDCMQYFKKKMNILYWVAKDTDE